MPRKRCHCCAVLWLLAAVWAPVDLRADDIRWLSGEPLRQALSLKVGVTWSNVPLRQSLTRFCRSQKLAFVLDRRIDPDQKVELSFEGVPLSEALQRIASRLDVGVAQVGSVAYFGPKSTADRIRTIAALRSQEASKAPPAARPPWFQLRALKWPDAAVPQELLEALGRDNKLQIVGLNQIPYDLWAAGDLPPLALTDRLTLLLAQFDLTFELGSDGRSANIVPLPDNPQIERSYPVTGSVQEIANRLRQNSLLAAAEISPAGNRLSIKARQEDHDIVKELLSGRPAKRTTVQEGKQVFTLQVNLAVDKLLEALGNRLQLEFRVDRDAIAAKGISLDTEVQIDVKEVSTDQLLRAVLDPVGLKFKRTDKIVEVMPK